MNSTVLAVSVVAAIAGALCFSLVAFIVYHMYNSNIRFNKTSLYTQEWQKVSQRSLSCFCSVSFSLVYHTIEALWKMSESIHFCSYYIPCRFPETSIRNTNIPTSCIFKSLFSNKAFHLARKNRRSIFNVIGVLQWFPETTALYNWILAHCSGHLYSFYNLILGIGIKGCDYLYY